MGADIHNPEASLSTMALTGSVQNEWLQDAYGVLNIGTCPFFFSGREDGR